MFIGIDLGTSNSSLAAFDGESVVMVPNSLGETLTPSVVRMDARGGIATGRKAYRFLESDPGNTWGEFKRLMGTAERLSFAAAHRELLPEELSAKVLESLLADARDALGFLPNAALISTPALFELPQNHATIRAGKLAGLAEVTLIQEPIASAIAAGWRAEHPGLWLVFDLGGGTLDVSLLETQEGRLRVVDHSGDNFLGGKDMDNALVTWAVGELQRERAWPHLDRSNPSPTCRRALSKLKSACEQAKIELSRQERTSIVASQLCEDAEGALADVDIPVARADLDRLIEPFVARSLGVVRSLLAKNKRGAEDVARVVLVGGPTLIPSLRERLAAFFGGRVAEGIDPMTVVARGAALYAATVGLTARPAVATNKAKTGLALRIEFPPVTADPEPFVVGRFLPAQGERLPERVRIVRQGAASATFGEVALSPEGSFVLQVALVRHAQNHFVVQAVDASGKDMALATRGFAIVHGVSVADPPLSRSVGVACADDSTQVYFPKGTPLPARRTFVHQTVQGIAAHSDDDALAIPVVQGESSRAHRNRLVGMLHIRGVQQDLPAGTRIEVTLLMDRSGQLHTRADVPALGRTFEDIAHVLVPTASLETAEKELHKTHQRVEDVRKRAFQAGMAAAVSAMEDLPEALAEAERTLGAARGGDMDASQKVHRLLLDINTVLDDAEAMLEWPELDLEAQSSSLYYTHMVAQWGTPAEQQLFDQALQAASEARRGRHAVDLERALQAMRSLCKASYWRDPQSLVGELDWLSAHVTEATDVARSQRLIEQARLAHQQGNQLAFKATLAEVWQHFPTSREDQRRSFGSGVR